MKQTLLVLLAAAGCLFTSCTNSSETQEYTSVWSPYSETVWTRSGTAAEAFKPTTGGFTFIANIADTGTYTYTFVPDIYVVSNMTTASGATVTFRSAVTSGQDTLALAGGGSAYHTFGTVAGKVQSFGADSVLTSGTAFTAGASSIALTVNPDQCSRQLRFNVTVSWKAYTGAVTASPLPKQKKITVELSDIQMRVAGIDVQKQ